MQLLKEEYMAKLMDFRKDEMEVPPLNVEEGEFNFAMTGTGEEKLFGIEDCNESADKIEERMRLIANVIRGIDKRMSYNLRLFGSVIMENDADESQNSIHISDSDVEQLQHILRTKSMKERMQTIALRLKKMTDFTINKLDLTGP